MFVGRKIFTSENGPDRLARTEAGRHATGSACGSRASGHSAAGGISAHFSCGVVREICHTTSAARSGGVRCDSRSSTETMRPKSTHSVDPGTVVLFSRFEFVARTGANRRLVDKGVTAPWVRPQNNYGVLHCHETQSFPVEAGYKQANKRTTNEPSAPNTRTTGRGYGHWKAQATVGQTCNRCMASTRCMVIAMC